MATESDAARIVPASPPTISVSTSITTISRSNNLEFEAIKTRNISNDLDIPSTLITTTTNVKIEPSDHFGPIYIERSNLLLSKLEYPRNGNNPGLVLIFNQENFQDSKTPKRRGSTRDVNEIVLCMGRLGFNITEDHIYKDYGRDEILDRIDYFLKKEEILRDVNSLIVFFLTHGDSLDFLHTNDATIRASEIWDKFSNCKHLQQKPKFFIFQACKGENCSMPAAEVANDQIEHNLVSDQTFSANHIGPDMLIAFATTEGNVSYRHISLGSWFIQELCRNFLAYGRRDDVVSLIIRTTKCVGGNYFLVGNDKKVKKQMPIFVSTLTKKFYLNRTKERNILLAVLQEHETMKEHIRQIENKVDEMFVYYNESKR